VEAIHIHPDYSSDDGTYKDDLAILVLKNQSSTPLYVTPICLWKFSADINNIVGETGTLVGWGTMEDESKSNKPRKISMPIVSHDDCIMSNEVMVHLVTKKTFCAGRKDGSGPCTGDSGGGFYMGYKEGTTMRWYLRGVIHLSLLDKLTGDCDLNNYLIYTDVAMYRLWIMKYLS
ncbi:hypothetical protein L9F63_026282, partial [Diploptera punctata]